MLLASTPAANEMSVMSRDSKSLRNEVSNALMSSAGKTTLKRTEAVPMDVGGGPRDGASVDGGAVVGGGVVGAAVGVRVASTTAAVGVGAAEVGASVLVVVGAALGSTFGGVTITVPGELRRTNMRTLGGVAAHSPPGEPMKGSPGVGVFPKTESRGASWFTT
mmetsp:Transcript_15123/g.32526  ORF Transcript_15123/g.32526 Transcript_15123/m.32526 type:complete len:163 (+) Transcript_15123:753-1241(+)